MSLARFSVPHLLIFSCAICLYSGGWWPWVFFMGFSVLVMIGDRLCPQDHADLKDVNPRAAESLLSIILPALIALVSLVIGSLALGAQQMWVDGTIHPCKHWALFSAWVCS